MRATEHQGSLADVRRRLAAELGLPIDLFARRSEGRLAHILPAKPSTRESRPTEKARRLGKPAAPLHRLHIYALAEPEPGRPAAAHDYAAHGKGAGPD